MATTSVVFTYPNGKGTELLDRFARHHRYSPTLPNGDANPETKLQFFERKLKEFVFNSITADRAEVEAEAARQADLAVIAAEIPIT